MLNKCHRYFVNFLSLSVARPGLELTTAVQAGRQNPLSGYMNWPGGMAMRSV